MAQVEPINRTVFYFPKPPYRELKKSNKKSNNSNAFLEELENNFLEKYSNFSKKYENSITIKRDYGKF